MIPLHYVSFHACSFTFFTIFASSSSMFCHVLSHSSSLAFQFLPFSCIVILFRSVSLMVIHVLSFSVNVHHVLSCVFNSLHFRAMPLFFIQLRVFGFMFFHVLSCLSIFCHFHVFFSLFTPFFSLHSCAWRLSPGTCQETVQQSHYICGQKQNLTGLGLASSSQMIWWFRFQIRRPDLAIINPYQVFRCSSQEGSGKMNLRMIFETALIIGDITLSLNTVVPLFFC